MKYFSLDDRTAMISTKADMDSLCEIDTCDNAKLNFQNIKKWVFLWKTVWLWISGPSSFADRPLWPKTAHFRIDPFRTCEPEIKIAEEFIETHCKKVDVNKVENGAQASGEACDIQKMMMQVNKM